MNYNEYLDAMRRLAVTDLNGSDQNFERMVPRMIDYAELRILRDPDIGLDLLVNNTAVTGTMTSGSRDMTVPSDIIIVKSVNAVSPAGAAPDAGDRIPLDRVSIDFLNFTWPSAATMGTPAKYALLTSTAVRFAPTPNAAYTAEFIGAVRPASIGADSQTTFISNYLPDLFIAASMIFVAGFQQNFGIAVNNPEMAGSWETQFGALKAGVAIEELRRRAGGI